MTVCPACAGENLDDARFCSHCGRALTAGPESCETCGAELPPDARFCPSCGTPHEPLGESERKLVTVLFSDITGFTPLGEALDPEDLKDVLDLYSGAMREEIEAEGGVVEKFIGDAVMAVFGAPVAHEDDAARALRSALRMRTRLDSLNTELERRHGVRLAMRIGVNTGEVVASRDARPEVSMVTGDAVNAAARLEQNAEPGQVLVSERTARSARGFRYRDVGPLAVKGKAEQIRTVELVDEVDGAVPGRQERGIPGLRAPMVGRDRELDLLRSLFGRLVSSGRAQLVTVYGDPGIGKSRLTGEFVSWVEQQPARPTVMTGRCLPYGEGVTYWPLAEIVKAHTGVLDSDAPEAALTKIGRLADDVLAAAPDAARAAAALAFTFGLEDPRFGFAGLPPRQVRLETHDAWRAFFTGLAAKGPLIGVVEDIHWADDALLDLLEDLADRIAGPLLFLCPSRPDLAQRRPGWGGGKRNFSSIFLEPLSHDDAARLVEFLLAVEELPGSTREVMLERAGGNPFFLEEIVRHLIDEGRIVREADRWRATDEITEIDIPDTIQGVLAARIDLLPAEERRVLRTAAVVGRVFWAGLVTELLGIESDRLDDILDRLEDRELVVSQVGSTVAGEREFVFKHILTRDVAYGTLPRRDRASAHASVAAWIESAAGARQREFADLLAHHYREAYEGALADPSVSREGLDELRRKALWAFLDASSEARSKMVLDTANAFGEAALAVASDARERSFALEALGLCALWDYRGDDAWRNLSAAVDQRLAAGPPDVGEGLAMLCARAVEPPTRWPASMTAPPSETAVARYVEIGLANAKPGEEAQVRLLIARAFWPFAFRREGVTDDDMDSARRLSDEAVRLALQLDRPDLASAALDAIGGAETIRGYHGWNSETYAQRLEIVERLTDPWEVGDALQTAADTALWTGDYLGARAWADEGFERSRTGPDVWRACLAWRGVARFMLGDWDGMLDDLRLLEASPASTRFGNAAYFHVVARSCGALLYELRGERAASDRLAAQAATQGVGAGTVRRIPWAARLAARRGLVDETFDWLERTKGPALAIAESGILEARCDVVADLGLWDLADQALADSRAFAELARLDALPLYADRLEGRAALIRGDVSLSVEALSHASDGFASLGARWEAAVANLWKAEALLAQGDRSVAVVVAEEALRVFDELRSVRELDQARSLLSRLD